MVSKFLLVACAFVSDALMRSLEEGRAGTKTQQCSTPKYWSLCNGDKAADNTNTIKRNSNPIQTRDGNFTIKNIAEVDGTALDLVITVLSDKYELSASADNVPHVSPDPNFPAEKPIVVAPCYLILPWKTKSATKFNWKFVEAGTSTPKVLQKFTLTVVELDQQTVNLDHESITFDSPYKLLSTGSSISQVVAGGAEFRSTSQGKTIDNPSISGPRDGCTPTAEYPYSCLTETQGERFVSVEYTNTAEWQLTLGHVGDGQMDRRAEFYGTTCSDSISSPTPSPTPCTEQYWSLCNGDKATENTNTLKRNSHDGNLTIKNIAVVDGTALDLVVTVLGESRFDRYELAPRAGNVPHVSPDPDFSKEKPIAPPCWIIMPWKTNSATKFSWKFVESGTSTPKVLEKFTMTTVELDQQTPNDHESITFDSPFTLKGIGSQVNEVVAGGSEFRSMAPGLTIDNPSISGPREGCTPTAEAPYDCLTDKQSQRTVKVEYTRTAEWQLTLGHKGPAQMDRHVEIYGTICA